MDKLKQWVALTAVLIVVIVAGGWFLLIAPKHSKAADIRAQSAAQVSANLALQTQLQTLKAQAKALPQQQAKLAAVAAKIPDNPALPSLIRALSVAADDANVELLSLAPGHPAVVTAPAAATAVAPVAPVGTGAAAPAAATAPGASAGTLEAISVNLSVVGSYFQVEQFLDRLESLQRAMKVGNLSLSLGSNPVKVAVTAPTAGGTAGTVATAAAPSGTLAAAISGTVYMASGRSYASTTAPTTGK